MLKVATKATAPRPVRGSDARRVTSFSTGGESAVTYPPMMMKLICSVNGIRLQKPLPNCCTTATG